MNYERELKILENKVDAFEKEILDISQEIENETLQSEPEGNFCLFDLKFI